MEIYKTIPGYENYEVSDLGNVRNVKTGIILKPQQVPKGYLQVILYNKDKKRKPFRIHKLVAMAFLSHVPCGMKITVDHVNGIRTDNRLENLEIVSMRENNIRGKARLNNTSQFPGVYWSKHHNNWRSMIMIENKKKHLGLFTSELEAAQAYQDALKQITN